MKVVKAMRLGENQYEVIKSDTFWIARALAYFPHHGDWISGIATTRSGAFKDLRGTLEQLRILRVNIVKRRMEGRNGIY